MNAFSRQDVGALLAQNGWTALNSAAIANRMFDTAVGPKEALVYLADFGADCDNLLLQGEYYSEGRNILEAHGKLVPRNASGVKLAGLVAEFAACCERQVRQSYAARLLAA